MRPPPWQEEETDDHDARTLRGRLGGPADDGTMITNELLDMVSEKARRTVIRDVRIGLGYTAVLLDSGACGLAYTFREEAEEGCSVLQQAGTVVGRSAGEVAAWANALDAVTAAVGVATLNALIEPPPEALEGDVRAMMRVRPEDGVGMVGYFGPLVTFLRDRAARLHIFERRPAQNSDVHPAWAAPVLLPECQVVIITSASLITRELDGLLAFTGGAREVVLLGPSTPMAPRVFARRHVSLLSGVQVTDSAALLRAVSEGGGTRNFGTAVRKLTLRLSAEPPTT
jgi:uncharacterized protein (DUF4213/DUF364 family)